MAMGVDTQVHDKHTDNPENNFLKTVEFLVLNINKCLIHDSNAAINNEIQRNLSSIIL